MCMMTLPIISNNKRKMTTNVLLELEPIISANSQILSRDNFKVIGSDVKVNVNTKNDKDIYDVEMPIPRRSAKLAQKNI